MTKKVLAGMIIGAVIFSSITIVGYYLGGFNFDQRGAEMLSVYVSSVFMAAFGAWIGAALQFIS